MSPKVLKTVAAALSIVVVSAGCENLTPGENAGLFGAAAGLATAIPLAVAGVDPSIVIPVTAGAVALAAGGAYLISKHQASERQLKIAEQRARIYLAERKAAEKKASRQAQAAKAPKKSRYIAVKTVKETNDKGKSQVMIFDTQSNQIVGNNVYDLKSTPQVGKTTKFDTYTAEYVGTGS